jgi:hypothetical protein
MAFDEEFDNLGDGWARTHALNVLAQFRSVRIYSFLGPKILFRQAAHLSYCQLNQATLARIATLFDDKDDWVQHSAVRVLSRSSAIKV